VTLVGRRSAMEARLLHCSGSIPNMLFESPGFSVKAIALGWLTAGAGSAAAGAAAALLVASGMGLAGAPEDRIDAAMDGAVMAFVYLSIVAVFTCLGGAVAGLVARDAEVAHAVLVAFVSQIPALLAVAFDAATEYSAAESVLRLPVSALGGYAARTWRRRRA
jgi:hypothetical protein